MIRKHILDFEILDTGNPKTLVFLDSSEYMEEPERPLLQITPPGYSKYLVANIVAKRVNTLNANTIGLSATLSTSDLSALPDGVWILKYTICPYDKVYIQKCHLRTVALDCIIDQIYDYFDVSDCSTELDEKMKNEMIEIILLLETGRAAAKTCNVKRAGEAYTKAKEKADKILNKLNGTCS